jgi:tetratricopeptide (TPR) repeat protein
MKTMRFVCLAALLLALAVGAYGQDSSNPRVSEQLTNFVNSIFGNPESSSSSADSDFEMSGTTLVKYNGSAANVTIPSNVTAIGEKAFYECDSIKSVTIPSSVISIGNEAFGSCENLTNITISSGVKTIGNWVFSSSGKLTNINIPSSVTSIGIMAFGACAGLTGITVDAQNITYSSVDGVLFNKAKTNLISYPNGKKGNNYTIPSGVTSIEEWAFAFCDNLTGITIPAGVTTIGDYAFAFCHNITSITLPATVTSIGEEILYYSNVKTVTLSRNTRTGDDAFPSDVRIIYSDSAPAAVQPDKAAYDRGRTAYDQKNYDRAITEFTEAIRLNPNYELAYYFRAETYVMKEDYDKALADLNQAIRLSPNDDDNYSERGYVYIIKNDYDRAIADFNQAIKLNPDNTDAKEGLELARQRKQNSSSQPAAAPPNTPTTTTTPVDQTRTPLQLPATIRDNSGKAIRYTVKAPNILEARGSVQDMGVIYLRNIPYNGQKTLVIKIRSMSGRFRWDNGKMFGVTFGNPNDSKSYLPAFGRRLSDKFIDGPFAVGDEVVFPLPNNVVISKIGPITFAMSIYGGAVFEVELYFE